MNSQQQNYQANIQEIAYAGDSVTYGFDVKHDNRDLPVQVQFNQDRNFNPTGASKPLQQNLWDCRIGVLDQKSGGQGSSGGAQTGTAMAPSAQAWNSSIPGTDLEVQQYTRACIDKFLTTHNNMALRFDVQPDNHDRQRLLDSIVSDLSKQHTYRQITVNHNRFIVPDQMHDQWQESLKSYTPATSNR